MRLKILWIPLFVLSGICLYGQKTPQELLKTTIDTAERVSLYSSEVNWDSLRTELGVCGEGATTTADLYPCFEMLFNGLRDHHATMRSAVDYGIVANFTDFSNSRKSDDREFSSEGWAIVNDLESRFEYALLDGNVGYLKVVGIGGNVDGQQEAERIRTAMEELYGKGVESWILDLRYNSGGNINVMMAGLAPLFPEGSVAGLQDAEKEVRSAAEIRDGNFYYMEVNAFDIASELSLDSPKIAVLLSRWTVSSGELLAISLKGQENVRFFGERTGGYTTNNGWDVLSDELFMSISTAVFCDRTGKAYEHFVEPDDEVEFEMGGDLMKDTGVAEAARWLDSH
jgi:carboxyl-terminal processing protease